MKKSIQSAITAVLCFFVLVAHSGCLADKASEEASAASPESVSDEGSSSVKVPESGPSEESVEKARKLYASLSLREAVAQTLMIGIPGTRELPNSTKRILETACPGAIILFSYNISKATQDIAAFTGNLQEFAQSSDTPIPFIVAIDHEGGNIVRIRSGITKIPSPSEVGKRNDPVFAGRLGMITGSELKSLGITMALAPVAEVLTDENAPFLGDRSYGSDLRTVIAMATGFGRGLESSGVIASYKHFPGNAEGDPHKFLPRLDADLDFVESVLFPPFEAAIRSGADCVMLSHVLVPALDSVPSSISHRVIEEILKGTMGFRGIVLTDDIAMAGVRGGRTVLDAAIAALRAGADMLMLTGGPEVHTIVDELVDAVEKGLIPRSRIEDAVTTILAVKYDYALWDEFDDTVRAERTAKLKKLVEDHGIELGSY